MKILMSLVLLSCVTSAFAWPRKAKKIPVLSCSTPNDDRRIPEFNIKFEFLSKEKVQVFVNKRPVDAKLIMQRDFDRLVVKLKASTKKNVQFTFMLDLEELSYEFDRAVINQRGPSYNRLTSFMTLYPSYSLTGTGSIDTSALCSVLIQKPGTDEE